MAVSSRRSSIGGLQSMVLASYNLRYRLKNQEPQSWWSYTNNLLVLIGIYWWREVAGYLIVGPYFQMHTRNTSHLIQYSQFGLWAGGRDWRILPARLQLFGRSCVSLQLPCRQQYRGVELTNQRTPRVDSIGLVQTKVTSAFKDHHFPGIACSRHVSKLQRLYPHYNSIQFWIYLDAVGFCASSHYPFQFFNLVRDTESWIFESDYLKPLLILISSTRDHPVALNRSWKEKLRIHPQRSSAAVNITNFYSQSDQYSFGNINIFLDFSNLFPLNIQLRI